MSTCFLYDVCNHKDCDKDFCLRKYKMDSLYSAALMTDSQKKHITLRVDEDGSIRAEVKTGTSVTTIVLKKEQWLQLMNGIETAMKIFAGGK